VFFCYALTFAPVTVAFLRGHAVRWKSRSPLSRSRADAQRVSSPCGWAVYLFRV